MKPEFGDYISVEQKRYVGENEFYTHKVIGTLRSNKWMDVPAITHNGMTLHDQMEEVVACICCGVCEEEVVRFRVADVKITQSKFPVTVQQQVSATDQALNELTDMSDIEFKNKMREAGNILHKPQQQVSGEVEAVIDKHKQGYIDDKGQQKYFIGDNAFEHLIHDIYAALPSTKSESSELKK